MLICLNGDFISQETATLPISDGGFLFGDTLFETFKAHGDRILLQAEHLQRLQLSAKFLNFPCDLCRITIALQQLAAKLTTPVSRIRLTISRGSHQGLALPNAEQGWFLLTATPMTEISNADRQTGAACVSAPNQRVNPLSHLPQMKRGNYADCLYAADFAKQHAAAEAVFIDQQGNVLEGSTSNIFAISDSQLLTPPIGSLILAGVMRRQVMLAAAATGLAVQEQPLPLASLHQAEEIFLSNSLIDILPVNSLDRQPCKRGERWQRLLKTVQTQIGA